jgi:hypothetical protein
MRRISLKQARTTKMTTKIDLTGGGSLGGSISEEQNTTNMLGALFPLWTGFASLWCLLPCCYTCE